MATALLSAHEREDFRVGLEAAESFTDIARRVTDLRRRSVAKVAYCVTARRTRPSVPPRADAGRGQLSCSSTDR